VPSGATSFSTNVLVVEDEMVLRMRAVDIVEDAGFTAVQAVNADEALSILESRSDIALLFCDIQLPGSMDGLKLAHAVHDRWPLIKIILVSGQVKLSDKERPADSRFFGKPLEVKQMIAELQEMVGTGALKVVTEDAIPLAAEARARTKPAGRLLSSTAQEFLTAENDSVRLLLEQAVIDAKVLLAQAGIDAKERETADKLQKLILDELHHRIKNTLATVSAIASQSLRTATSIEHADYTTITSAFKFSVRTGQLWIGRASWPTSRGRWTRSCCCETNIWPRKTGSSRRIDPINLSANAFCQGEPAAMGLSRMPMARIRCLTAAP